MFPYQETPPPSHFEYVIESSAPAAPIFISFNAHTAAFKENVKQEAFKCMAQLEGWCSELKTTTLIDLVLKKKPNIIVEIGVWGGKSLVPMACALKANAKGKIIGIDPWESTVSIEEMMEEANKNFWAHADHHWILNDLQEKIKAFDLRDQIVLIKSSSENAAPISGIDILHIDGNHSDKTSYLDVTKWVPLMNSGGYVIFDDMTWCEKGVVTTSRAIEWLDAHCIKIAQFSDIYCIWGVWMKP